MSSTDFCWVPFQDVPKTVIDAFDSGNPTFNDFLKEKAGPWQENGETVTYLIVTENEKEAKKYSRIHGYVSINTMGLLYTSEDDKESRYLPISLSGISMYYRTWVWNVCIRRIETKYGFC